MLSSFQKGSGSERKAYCTGRKCTKYVTRTSIQNIRLMMGAYMYIYMYYTIVHCMYMYSWRQYSKFGNFRRKMLFVVDGSYETLTKMHVHY